MKITKRLDILYGSHEDFEREMKFRVKFHEFIGEIIEDIEMKEYIAYGRSVLGEVKIGDTVNLPKPTRFYPKEPQMKEELKNKLESLESELDTLKLQIITAYDAIHDVSQRFQLVRQYFLSIKTDIDSGE